MANSFMIDRLRLFLFKIFVRGANLLNLYNFLSAIFSRFVYITDEHGKLTKPTKNTRTDCPTVLFINYDHYIAIIKVLAAQKELRCLVISTGLLRYLLAAFVPEPTSQYKLTFNQLGIRHEFRMAKPGSSIYKARKRYRDFLCKLIPNFFEHCGIDIVINSDMRYRREADFSRVASNLGYPHLCITRESMFIVPFMFAKSVLRHKNLGTFHGDQILVQNEVSRQVFLESGHARAEQITVLGSIRLDEFISSIKSDHQQLQKQKMVLMFSWPLKGKTMGGSLIDLHGSAITAMRAMTRAALELPDVAFAVKFKPKHASIGQYDSLYRVMKEIAGDSTIINNIKFYIDEISASELIQKASIICAQQSTTVLEAAAKGKPVILPHFKELRDESGTNDALMYWDNRHLFDVPDTEDDMVDLIKYRLNDSTVPDAVIDSRLQLFEHHIAPLTGDGAKRCLKILQYYATLGRKKRSVKE